jgi:hypothetical protein
MRTPITPALAAIVVLHVASPAAADGSWQNLLIGPLIGYRVGGPDGSRAIYGVEGGFGVGPERLNLGLETRNHVTFAYIEIDPWFVVGGSLGVGADSEGAVQPVLGLWEGLPIASFGRPDCVIQRSATSSVVTLAFGYRYTGVHELYSTLKVGILDQGCIGD